MTSKSDCKSDGDSNTKRCQKERAQSLISSTDSKDNVKTSLSNPGSPLVSRVVGGAIKLEDTNSVPLAPTVQVCPINVEQGDSILVKLKDNDGML